MGQRSLRELLARFDDLAAADLPVFLRLFGFFVAPPSFTFAGPNVALPGFAWLDVFLPDLVLLDLAFLDWVLLDAALLGFSLLIFLRVWRAFL